MVFAIVEKAGFRAARACCGARLRLPWLTRRQVGRVRQIAQREAPDTRVARRIEILAVYAERELIKLASLAAALADTLRQRGVKDPAAGLTAEAGIAVFKIAFERWIDETDQQDLPQLIRESFDALKAVTAGN